MNINTIINTRQLLERYQKDGLVFKSCDTYILVLQKLRDTKTNEARKVHNKNRANYRANKFRVIDIVSKLDESLGIVYVLKEYDEEGKEKELTEITSDYSDSFIYRKNEIVECKNFDKNIDNVCAGGIHYYLLWTSAFQHNLFIILMKLNDYYKYTGKCYHWGNNGKLYSESYYINSKSEGIEETWYDNGNLRSIDNWKNGEKNGITKVYYENGVLFSENNYINGYPDGECKYWHENGELSETVYYKNTYRNGHRKGWNEKGVLKFDCEYKNDRRHGKSVLYYEKNGLPQEEQNYINGILNGISRKWDIHGTLREEVTYTDGIKHGPYKIWNTKGKLVKAGIYGNDGNIACTMNPPKEKSCLCV